MHLIYKIAAPVFATAVVLGMAGNVSAASLSGNPTPSLNAGVGRDAKESVSTSSVNTVSDDLASELQATLDRNLGKTPGATVGIISPLGTWFGSSGVSNLATGTPVKPDDRFQIGSITKTFTATTVLQLAEEGKLGLEDTLDKWLPDIANKIPDGNSITIRQLLNGTSGIVDYIGQWTQDVLNDPSLAFKNWQPEELVAYAYGKPRFSGYRCYPEWCYPNT